MKEINMLAIYTYLFQLSFKVHLYQQLSSIDLMLNLESYYL